MGHGWIIDEGEWRESGSQFNRLWTELLTPAAVAWVWTGLVWLGERLVRSWRVVFGVTSSMAHDVSSENATLE